MVALIGACSFQNLFAEALEITEHQARVSALNSHIQSLSVRGEFGEAADSTSVLISILESNPDTPPYIVSDSKRHLQTLRFIAGLPEEGQAELARAERLVELARLAYESEDYESGISKYSLAIDIYEKRLGANHEKVALVCSEFGGKLANHYRDRALRLLERAEKILFSLVGDQHIEYANLLQRRANALFLMRPAEAESIMVRSLALKRKILGNQHQDLIQAIMDLTMARGFNDFATPGSLPGWNICWGNRLDNLNEARK